MELLMGLLGALLGVGLVVCGFLFGKYVYAPKSSPVAELSVEEKTRLMEEREQLKREQEAFKTLMAYNADMAYGVEDSSLPNKSG